MNIRDATSDDAIEGCAVLRRSIAELCQADHKGDPAILDRWLENKTVENFSAWIAQTENSLLVVVENGRILAVGSVTDAGRIGLNYVSPDARFRGVSRALLQNLEARAAQRGNALCTLTSTETARRFYLSNGYKESGAPTGAFGTTAGYPMTKVLRAVRGGCLCGLVEFEADLPFIKFVRCHCSRCRRATGSAFATNAYVFPQAFRWLSGEDQVARFDLPLARSFSTSFCRVCGSPLPHATRSGREVIIPAGSITDDPGTSPTADACWQSRAPWLSDVSHLPTTD